MENHIVLSLRELLQEGYDENKIIDSFKGFKCPLEKDLEDFLINNAIRYEKGNIGKTYLFVNSKELEESKFVVDAYVTLAIKSIDISAMSGKAKRKMLGNYPGRDAINNISAFLIGQLGRSEGCNSEEISGEDLLNECYAIFKQASELVGGELIILECREHMYEKFYEHQGFKKIRDSLNEDGLFELYKKLNFE